MENDPKLVNAVAEAWASIDGKLEAYEAERDGKVTKESSTYTGHYDGYQAEAKELLGRILKRIPGLQILLPTKLDEDALVFCMEVTQITPAQGRKIQVRIKDNDLERFRERIPMELGIAHAQDMKTENSQTLVTMRTLKEHEQVRQVEDREPKLYNLDEKKSKK